MTLDSSPTVSVVIPVYNGERFLADAIQSVLHQTYKDYELIVVDDGSTDQSASVVRSYKDDRIRYLYQSNGGASKARNVGAASSRGAVVAFLDSDDAWFPHKLERQVDYLASHKEVGAVYCWYEVLEPNGSRRVCSLSVGHNPWEIFKTGCGLLPSATTFRKEVLQKVGGFDEAFLGSEYQDLELSLRLSEITKFACLPEVLLLYRHPESIGAHPGKSSLGHLLNRGIYLNKYLSRYQGDERICKHILHLMVGYWSDLGKLKLTQGQLAEGRKALVNALRLSVEQRTNAKMFLRTLLRLIRSYF